MNILSNLKIKCMFIGKGCQAIVKLSDIASHESNCEYNIKYCNKCQSIMNDNRLHVCDINQFPLINTSSTLITNRSVSYFYK